jgi:hypothetical protein
LQFIGNYAAAEKRYAAVETLIAHLAGADTERKKKSIG